MILRDLAVPDPQGWQNVADAIFHNARRRPAHAAIVDGARTITYADLAVLVAKTAGHLWYAIVAPPATPAALADKISKDVADVVKDPATAEIIRSKLQMDPIGSSGAEAAKLFADETKLWAKVIKDANVSLD